MMKDVARLHARNTNSCWPSCIPGGPRQCSSSMHGSCSKLTLVPRVATGPRRRLRTPWTPVPPPSIGCARPVSNRAWRSPWLASARPGRQYRKRDGAQEAQLIAVACSTPPAGRVRGTLQLLADKLVALDIVATISPECVPHHAQKNALKPGPQQQWVIPPQANAAFVCAMEDVLEVYTRPYDPRRPQVCLDETSKQLVAETREPMPATPGQPARVD